jgi:16S rRNA (cytosine1402-N4)-methyltransferase
MSAGLSHVPVLLHEAVALLAPAAGGLYLDATFGGGGYAANILDGAACTLWAIDRDPAAIARGAALAARHPGRLHLIEGGFGDLLSLLSQRGVTALDGAVFDLGVSSFQIDDPARGFSFRHDGPLDMRMAGTGATAADLVNQLDETELADILYQLGEERLSRRIARAIVAARPLTTTGELARIVRKALGYRPGAPKDPATRTFQAIRIHVNAELDELEAGLAAADVLLGEGGRLAVVSFHSLEDRIVKQFLRDASGAQAATSRYLPEAPPTRPPVFRNVSKAIRPSAAELDRNPRARSATLRFATRSDAPARGAPTGAPTERSAA